MNLKFTYAGITSCFPSQDNTDIQNVIIDNMNNNQSSSKSKRRRQRRKNRKITESQIDSNNQNSNCNYAQSAIIEENEYVVQEKYTVQSPVELAENKNCTRKINKPVKSRSLDDDEMVKIQEVSEVSESEDKGKDTQAIVSEASESEVEWEETSEFDTPLPIHGSLSTFTLPLEGYSSEQITLMSPDEEKTLRDFLEGLNLVNGPEEAASQVYDNNSAETIRQRKARKKAELEQYFLPIYQNPRYLDVISEENSDRDSDREQSKSSLTSFMRKGTPEQDGSSKIPPETPPRPNRDRRKMLSKATHPIEQQPAILVDTKLIETTEKSESVCSTFTTSEEAKASNVEIVYLTSSGTDSAEELESNSSDSYVVGSDGKSSLEDLSEKTLVNIETAKTVSNAQESNNSYKFCQNEEFSETNVKPHETMTNTSSTQYSFSVKSNKNVINENENIVNIDLLSQLTPPPTPDDMSPIDTKDKDSPDTSMNIFINNRYLRIEPETYTNVLTPPPPSRSPSSSRSSSRESSLCTDRYIPSSSSITDISCNKDEVENDIKPLTLREICLKFLLSLPFGKEVLEELADVSKYIESYTSSLPSTVLPKLVPNLASFVGKENSNSNNLSHNLSVHLPPKIPQEDIAFTKVTSKIERKENFHSSKEKILLKKDKNGNSIESLNKNIPMERRIPIEIERGIESLTQEKVVPINDDKFELRSIEINTKKIENQSFTREDNKRIEKSELKISSLVDKHEVKHEIKKEIHVKKSNAEPEEFIIPITKEENDIINQIQKETKVFKHDDKIHSEEVIPIKIETENKSNEIVKGEVNTKSVDVIIPIQKKMNVHVRCDKEKNSKEFIIPMKKDETEPEKEQKPKEFIIPITTETSNVNVNSYRDNEEMPQEFIIPIKKPGSEPSKEPTSKEFTIPPTAGINQNLTDIMNTANGMKVRTIPIVKEWIGMPTARDPKLLICLSPKQKDHIEKSKQVPDEADKLLELHEKFINRKISHEEIKQKFEEKVILGSDAMHQPQNHNRLLTIIKEETPITNDDKNYLYFIDKEPQHRKQGSTLPRMAETARLNAKDLTEWLNLARNKSMSESNLTTVPDIPENNLRSNFIMQAAPLRRTSLPHELFEKQMIYIQEKEREIQRQLEVLEEEKRLLNAEMAPSKQFHAEDYHFSRKGDFAESKKRPISMPMMPTEYFRQQMYEEYLDKFAEREERKQHKIIKVTSSKDIDHETEAIGKREIIHPIQIEDEFMHKVKALQSIGKLEKLKSLEKERESDKEEDEPPVLVIDGEKLKEAKELPKHLQEFVGADGIWSPGQTIDLSPKDQERKGYEIQQNEPIPPVWTPKSASSSPVVERKEFRPVNFHSPVLGRRNRTTSENLGSQNKSQAPPWKTPDYNSDTGSAPTISERRLPISRSTPASGFSEVSSTSRLPKAQNPTITLLQKAREGQLPKGASYLEQEPRHYKPKNDRPPIAGPGEVFYQIKNEYTSEFDNEKPRKMTELGSRKFEGIGPVTKDGIPLVLRSEVKDQNQSKWYKRMYDTIHKQKPHTDEYVTIRYKQKRAQYPYSSGYLSEPEPGAYDSDFTDYKYQTLDRRRPLPQDRSSDYITSTMPRSAVNRSHSSDIGKNTQEYKSQPGKIENYTPGHSSIAEKEAKQWWDEVMDIFDGHLEQQNRQLQSNPRSFINQAMKESGYESDSTLVFRRREEAAQQLSPVEQREAYKVIQKGGDVPLHGLRKPAPEKPKEPEPPVPPPKGQYARNLEQESPRKYVENEVTIHYKTPVRQEIKDYLSEDELAHRQAEAMKKIYQEERRKKYLQELQDMNSRRHTDNFIPSQKSPISLNRYDDFDDLAPNVQSRARSPEHRLCARALYNFVGQSARELTFRKGDIIYLRRQIDKNWYEGELNAMVGLFPANYVEIIPSEGTKAKSTLRKAHEGQARAKYNFVAQTHLELSLAKGELVVVTRKIDDNWYEGKIGGRKGIFPSNYVEILIDPQSPNPTSTKPVASPAAHSLLLNGSSGGKQSMGSHSYMPSLPNDPQLTSSYHAKPVQIINNGNYNSLGKNLGISQALHIETQSEPTPYRAMYKYQPQNEDELELLEGDTVYVLEKCDDGWYVGSSERTGAFGTFPGNYVEKI